MSVASSDGGKGSAPRPIPDPKWCSFCGTPKSAAQKFVQGPKGKNICGACITHATKRLKENEDGSE